MKLSEICNELDTIAANKGHPYRDVARGMLEAYNLGIADRINGAGEYVEDDMEGFVPATKGVVSILLDIERLRSGIKDLMTGAEQQSQSHIDVAVKCRALLNAHPKEDPYLTSAVWSMEDRYIVRFESRIEDGHRFWWGSEGGWIGRNGVLTFNAAAFPVGTILTLGEPPDDSRRDDSDFVVEV